MNSAMFWSQPLLYTLGLAEDRNSLADKILRLNPNFSQIHYKNDQPQKVNHHGNTQTYNLEYRTFQPSPS
jgi:hypothetical protein